MLDVYYWPTPNGQKVAIFLEESGIPYNIVPLDIGRGDQLKPEYLKINPNHRMPAIVDHDPLGGGAPLSIFESGAILIYLADKTGQFCPRDANGKYDVFQWVIWQAANLGPKLGEMGHFMHMGGRFGDQSYAMERYSNEANRLFGVMNYRLHDRPWLAGDAYTIADMMCYPWIKGSVLHGHDISEFPHLGRWFEAVDARPGAQRGMDVAKEHAFDPAKVTPEELEQRFKIMFNQRAIAAPAD